MCLGTIHMHCPAYQNILGRSALDYPPPTFGETASSWHTMHTCRGVLPSDRSNDWSAILLGTQTPIPLPWAAGNPSSLSNPEPVSSLRHTLLDRSVRSTTDPPVCPRCCSASYNKPPHH